MRSVGFAALLCVMAVCCACSGTATSTTEAEKTGGVVLQVIAPPEAADLWPLPSGWKMKITRRRGDNATPQVALDSASPGASPRVQPFAGDVTTFRVSLLDKDGSTRAVGVTPPAIVDSSAPDRQMHVFIAPVGANAKVVTVVDTDGAKVQRVGRLGEAMVVSNGGEIFLTGGCSLAGGNPCALTANGQPVSDVWRFDPADHSLTKLSSMTSPRSFHTATALGSGPLVLAGGYLKPGSGTASVSDTVDLLQANQGTLQAAPSKLAKGRARHCAIAMGQRVLFAGGDGPGGATIELWDPGVGAIASGSLLQPRRDATCAAFNNPVTERTELWLIGGASTTTGSMQTAVDRIEIWSVDGGKLLQEGVVQMPSSGVSMAAAAVLPAPWGVAIIGGFATAGAGSASRQTWWRPLPSGSWSKGAELSTARGCAAVATSGTKVFVLGGMNDDGEPTATGDVVSLEAVAPKIAATLGLPQPLAAASMVKMPNGAMLLSGGVAMEDGNLSGHQGLLWMWP